MTEFVETNSIRKMSVHCCACDTKVIRSEATKIPKNEATRRVWNAILGENFRKISSFYKTPYICRWHIRGDKRTAKSLPSNGPGRFPFVEEYDHWVWKEMDDYEQQDDDLAYDGSNDDLFSEDFLSTPCSQMEEFYKELNRPPPPVKLETADVENAVNTSTTDDLLTGLDELGELMETEQKKEEEDMAKLAEYMDQEEKEPTSLIKKRRGKKSTPDGDEKRPNEETKSPLTTFGHSSRPRRSVNYANIERGDEAQAQSLVTEFTSSKKRPKRSRDELDENYEEENGNTSKRKNKKRSSWLSSVGKQSSNNIQLLFDEEQCREAEFALCVPSISDERPSSEYRTIGKALDSHVAIRRASGGFRRFVAWLSDSRIITMMTTVERRHVMNTDSEDKRLVKSVRHVYNSMPQHYRRDWEYAAKMDVFESRHFVQGLSMPVSEIVMKSSVEKPPRNDGVYVQSNCCSMQPQLSEMRQVAEHYLSEHDVVHFFGCDFCHKVFTSRFELTKHDCHDFATMLLEKTMRQESLEMQAAYMFLCCSECGLWLPVKTSISGMKGWNYFATALANHTCLPLVSIIVYFREALPDDGRSIRMSFQFVCSVDVCFPLSCQECKTEDFRTVAEAEDHFLKNHVPLQCSKCPKTFGTEFLFKHHQQIHIAQSAQFANYLTYSATYQPPPNSGRLPHIGFKSEITTIGGFTAVEVAALESADAQADEEFVEPFADTKKAKLLRWRRPDSEKKAKSSDSDSTFSMEKDKLTDSESDSYSSSSETGSSNKRKKAKKDKKQQKKKEFRPDFGYEHINRNELFGREKEEQQAIDGLEKLMHKKLFHSGEHLLNPEDVLKFLEEAVEPKLPVETDSGLAEEIAAATLKIVNLPISNCIDPLKDLMLINKIFYYCKSCQMVFSTDPQEHCSTICETSEDDLMELFHAGCGPYHGIRCVSPACDRKMCSVTSLRNHASTVHNITVALEMMPPSATEILLCHRYDRSMMMLAKHFCEMQTESRTPMARFTDLECYMPFNGLLERKSVLPSLTPAAGSQFARPILPRNNGSLVNGRLAHSGVLVSGSSVSHQLLKSAMNVKPYRIPRTSRWYSCQWCDREFEQLASFVQHLTKTHIHPCQLCGKAFSNAACKRSHTCQRGFDSDGSHRSILTGSCAVCKDRFPIEILFSHYLKRHFSVVEYNQATGEMLPLASDIRLEPLAASRSFDPIAQTPSIGLQEMRTDYRLKLIKMSATPVHGVSLSQLSTRIAPMGSYAMVPPSLKNLDPRLMCYMCEMTHDSVSELLVHLEEAHPERWDQCPFCQTKVDGHHDLQKHLMEAHVIHQDGKTICEFCNESHYRFMCSHLLYRCRKKPCCTICGQKAQDPAVNYSHMRRSHAVTFKRFQCAFCPALFISIGEYYDHTCVGQQARVYSCCCSPDKYFPSVNGFCDHFDSMHVIRNRCKICNIDAPSQENLARHRMSHIIAEAVRNPPRQVFILEKSLFPKKPQVHSSYHRWMEGGVPPPSYIKSTDRSMLNFSTTLMGRESPELTAPINAATGRKLTLFDVLEGGLSTNGNGSQQRVVTLQTANRVDTSPPAKSTQSGDDVIMLSDDDDDLDIVYDSSAQNGAGKNGSPDESLQNGQSGQSQQFSSQVRVEQSEKGYGTSEQPGYVVDDETEVVEPRKTPLGSEPVVKEVVDENGDDELAVVAEVENATGILPSSISFAREKKFKCAQCSNAYYTNGSLQVHIQGHKQDAGAQSCGETYGLPVNCAAFICRNCCIVFENQRKYDEHTKIHGDTIHACNHCSGIAFNLVTITNHMNAHNNRAVTYGCGTCTVKFHSDLALMDHLHITHDVKLFYFCKVCGFGSTDPDRVVNHMSVHSDHHYTMVQRFGACPVQLLNYEPDDEQKFRMKWQSKAIELYEPSDCTHRSMLLSNETVVSCKTCHCTQAWFNFLAFNGHSEETGFPHFRLIEPYNDSRGNFPLIHHLNPANEQKMLRYGNSTSIVSRTTARFALPNTRNTPLPPHRQVPGQRPPPIAPIVTVTPNGTRIIRPGTPSGGITMTRGGVTPMRRVVVTRPDGSGSGGHGSMIMQQVQPIRIRQQTDNSQCTECEKTISNEFDRHLHQMHTEPNSWFCRQCGVTEESEIKMFIHYIKEHLSKAYQNHRSSGFKSNVFRLRCPIAACKDAEFLSTKTFDRHMRTNHEDLLPYDCENCDARFATKILQKKHDKKHQEYFVNNGTDASCCSICGTFDMWMLPKDVATDCLQSHLIRHGLDYRSGCRECLRQFPADVHQSVVVRHMRAEHSLVQPDSAITCKICGEMGIAGEDQFMEHCKNAHVFNMLVKSVHSQRGELVITTGLEYENYVGLKTRPVPMSQPLVKPATSRTRVPSTSSSSSDTVPLPSISLADGGNAALLSIAAGISVQSPLGSDDGVEETIE